MEVAVRGGAPTARSARWVVIVRRDQPRLYRSLRQEFDGIAPVEVVLDRRREDEGSAGWAAQAPGDRRRPLAPKERTRWRSFGYQIVRRHEEPVAGWLSA